MTDTPPHVEKLQRDLLMRRSGAERLLMGCAMFDTARRLVRAGLGDPQGTDRSPEMKAHLFLRIYGPDFDAASRERIAAWLRHGGRARYAGRRAVGARGGWRLTSDGLCSEGRFRRAQRALRREQDS